MKTKLLSLLLLSASIAQSQVVERSVTFRVDMTDLIGNRSFNPNQDKIQILGSPSPLVWDTQDTTNDLIQDSSDLSKNIYYKTDKFKLMPGTEIVYKFRLPNYNRLINDGEGLGSGMGFEGNPNRTYIFQDKDTLLPVTKSRHYGLGIPDLIYPPTNSADYDTAVTLKWNKINLDGINVSPKFSYQFRIQIAEDSLFAKNTKD